MLAVPLEILVRVQALSQLAVTGKPMRRCIIVPALSGLGEGLAGRDVLVPSRASDSCGGPCAMHTDTVVRYTVFPPTYWYGLNMHCIKKQCDLAELCFRGCTALDLHLSRVRTGVAAMRQDCNYHLDTTKLWRKRGKKHTKQIYKNKICGLSYGNLGISQFEICSVYCFH